MNNQKSSISTLRLATAIIYLITSLVVLFQGVMPTWSDGKINSMPLIYNIIIVVTAFTALFTYKSNNAKKSSRINLIAALIALLAIFLLYKGNTAYSLIYNQAISATMLKVCLYSTFAFVVIYGITSIIQIFSTSKKPVINDNQDYEQENNLDNINNDYEQDELSDEELERIGEKKSKAPRHMATEDDKLDNNKDNLSKEEKIDELPEKEKLDKPLDGVEQEKEERVAPRKEVDDIDDNIETSNEIQEDNSLKSKLAPNTSANGEKSNDDSNDNKEDNSFDKSKKSKKVKKSKADEKKKFSAEDLDYSDDSKDKSKPKKKLIKK